MNIQTILKKANSLDRSYNKASYFEKVFTKALKEQNLEIIKGLLNENSLQTNAFVHLVAKKNSLSRPLLEMLVEDFETNRERYQRGKTPLPYLLLVRSSCQQEDREWLFEKALSLLTKKEDVEFFVVPTSSEDGLWNDFPPAMISKIPFEHFKFHFKAAYTIMGNPSEKELEISRLMASRWPEETVKEIFSTALTHSMPHNFPHGTPQKDALVVLSRLFLFEDRIKSEKWESEFIEKIYDLVSYIEDDGLRGQIEKMFLGHFLKIDQDIRDEVDIQNASPRGVLLAESGHFKLGHLFVLDEVLRKHIEKNTRSLSAQGIDNLLNSISEKEKQSRVAYAIRSLSYRKIDYQNINWLCTRLDNPAKVNLMKELLDWGEFPKRILLSLVRDMTISEITDIKNSKASFQNKESLDWITLQEIKKSKKELKTSVKKSISKTKSKTLRLI